MFASLVSFELAASAVAELLAAVLSDHSLEHSRHDQHYLDDSIWATKLSIVSSHVALVDRSAH